MSKIFVTASFRSASRLLLKRESLALPLSSVSSRPMSSLLANQKHDTFLSNAYPSNAVRTTHASSFLKSRETVTVPTMGDSITEGTIVEWCVEPGTLVKEGDVLALIETDKVTVDIKAEKDGVVVEHLGEVEGVVEVGQGLYVMDSDVSTATIQSSSLEDTLAKEDQKGGGDDALDGVESTLEDRVSGHRTPSIHFLGKDGWRARLAATDSSPASPTATPTTIHVSAKPNSPSSTTYIPYNSMYGRPPINDDEIEALLLGGAEEAPEMKKVVSKDGLHGAVFLGGKIVTAGPRGVWLAEEKM